MVSYGLESTQYPTQTELGVHVECFDIPNEMVTIYKFLVMFIIIMMVGGHNGQVIIIYRSNIDKVQWWFLRWSIYTGFCYIQVVVKVSSIVQRLEHVCNGLIELLHASLFFLQAGCDTGSTDQANWSYRPPVVSKYLELNPFLSPPCGIKS